MLGSSGFLALWILAATPAGEALASDATADIVAQTSFQAANPLREKPIGLAYMEATDAPPKTLPRDAAFAEGIPGLPSADAQGIPGLPPTADAKETPEMPPSPSDMPKIIERPKAIEPPRIIERPKTVEAPIYDEGSSDAYEGVFGRRGFRNRWLDGVGCDGWIDQGVTINTLSPRDRSNGTVGFNNRSNEYQLNQAYLRLRRDVVEGDRWDIGGRVDLLYGTDSIYTSARGLELTDENEMKWNAQQYGLSMAQAYAEVYAPWGNGLTMKLGHFYSILGYETAAAPENFFYSHSYAYLYGEPKTQTGLIGSTRLGGFTLQAGMTRGWDNWDDENNDLAFTGSLDWTSENERTSIALDVDAGREQDDPSTNTRTIVSLVIQQKLGRSWQYVFQNDYGNEPGAGTDGSTANWYGIDQYLFYTVNERWKAGMRFEWFRDEGGSRVPEVDQTADYFGLSAGMNWTPGRRVIVRPELRWDWTGTEGVYPFGDGTRSSQLLVDCDVIVRF